MNRMIVCLLLFLLPAGFLQSEETWEGNAAIIRKGEFEVKGLFAASNSFPKNSSIRVENMQNGKQVQVTVLKRIDGPGNVFFLLSEEAAVVLGMSSSEVVRVNARLVNSLGVEIAGLPDDLPYNPDPDINPAAGAPDLEADSGEKPPVESPEVNEQKTEELPVEEHPLEEQKTEEPEAEEQRPEDLLLKKLASRSPQKQLFMPPREAERFALVEIPEPEEVSEKAAPEPPPVVSLALPREEKTIEAPLTLPELDQEEEEKPTPEGKTPVRPARPESEFPAPELPRIETEEIPEGPGRVVVTLEPTEPQPPPKESGVEPLLPQPEAEELPLTAREEIPPAGEEFPLVEKLPEKSHFLQLGAYATRSRAEKLVLDLDPVYTGLVLPVTLKSRVVYKVLIGPLTVDESGTLLYHFKARGFKDAFLTRSD